MNALAGDQAGRLGKLLDEDPRLAEVTAGLYIGEASARRTASPYGRVMVDRSEIRRNPPDILITNYKMLDLLLQRQLDAPLWADADLAYVVIDEFHTYDGAQGTDVAMLLRRLGAVAGAAEEGRPLGSVCPVATSATLGESGPEADPQTAGAGGARAMLDVASRVFGTYFPDDAVIGEDRREPSAFLKPLDVSLPVPPPGEVAALPDPAATGGPAGARRARLRRVRRPGAGAPAARAPGDPRPAGYGGGSATHLRGGAAGLRGEFALASGGGAGPSDGGGGAGPVRGADLRGP